MIASSPLLFFQYLVPEVSYFRGKLHIPAFGEFNTLISWTISHITKVTSASRIRNVQFDTSIVAAIWFADRFTIGGWI